MDTINIEDKYSVKFFEKIPLSIERGEGLTVWDENGREYLDFTSGWAVTCLGYSHPVIIDAIIKQSKKIMHNPNAGLTYSPSRALLLMELVKILPGNLHKLFFTNSGAEANDAAMKLARKITKRKKILSARMSFHGRTLATSSATGQAVQRDRYNVLVPYFDFFDINDFEGFKKCIDDDTAAVIIEPMQGEGGVIVIESEFLLNVQKCCKENGTLLIVDEIQTGFFRTGPAFLSEEMGIQPDFLTLAKGIAGGFPFGAVAVTKEMAGKIENGDHGGTYNGNPLGCAVAAAVVKYMVENNFQDKVNKSAQYLEKLLLECKSKYPELIKDVRGKGLLWAIDFVNAKHASYVLERAQEYGLLLNLKHGTIIRIFPALVITEEEMGRGVEVIKMILSEINN
jgi:acetylornithine/N-succinyldiaminopimelate aminotransferase